MKIRNDTRDNLLQYIKSNIGDRDFYIDEIRDPQMKKLFWKYVIFKHSIPNPIYDAFIIKNMSRKMVDRKQGDLRKKFRVKI